jgi:hypothetical protein
MSDLLANGLLVPVLSSPPAPPEQAGLIKLFYMDGSLFSIDFTGAVVRLTN